MRKCDLNKDYNFTEITLPHGCSPVNLLDIFRTAFCKNTYGGLLLAIQSTLPIRIQQEIQEREVKLASSIERFLLNSN